MLEDGRVFWDVLLFPLVDALVPLLQFLVAPFLQVPQLAVHLLLLPVRDLVELQDLRPHAVGPFGVGVVPQVHLEPLVVQCVYDGEGLGTSAESGLSSAHQ